MTDTEKRKKVIRGLISCKNHWCAECPYAMPGMKCCGRDKMFDDALALLKEQEPRVMTLEELQAIETPWERNTPPYFWMENRVGGGSFWVRWPNILYAMIWHKIYGNRTYGSEWRVWNLKPTPEQMEETPWEEVHRET